MRGDTYPRAPLSQGALRQFCKALQEVSSRLRGYFPRAPHISVRFSLPDMANQYFAMAGSTVRAQPSMPLSRLYRLSKPLRSR